MDRTCGAKLGLGRVNVPRDHHRPQTPKMAAPGWEAEDIGPCLTLCESKSPIFAERQ
jgi:hypothetical protein